MRPRIAIIELRNLHRLLIAVSDSPFESETLPLIISTRDWAVLSACPVVIAILGVVVEQTLFQRSVLTLLLAPQYRRFEQGRETLPIVPAIDLSVNSD